MKLLFDPIYTGRVHKCASTVKFVRLAEALLQDPNVFIYWSLPDWIDEEGLNWLPTSERIHYFRLEQSKDRYKEYRRISYERECMFSYQGDFWDWDICVTNRTSMVPTINAVANFHSRKSDGLKPVLVVEDFPLMAFKGAAAINSTQEQDMYTVLGYQTAAQTYICAYWEKALILESARAYLAPSEIKKLRERIIECHPFTMSDRPKLKTQSFVKEQPSKPFTIVFAGRMVNGHKFDKIFSIMGSNWILKSQERQINAVVCTQSASEGLVEVPDFVKVNHFNRDQFWDFMANEASVGLFFSAEEDYSMSLIEPLMLGVPYAVYKAPWAVASLGEDYPFYFRSEQEAYTVVKAFYDDYITNYLMFAKWHTEKFRPLLAERDKTTIPSMVMAQVQKVRAQMSKVEAPADLDAVAHLLAGQLTEEPQSIAQLIESAAKHNPVRTLADKMQRANQMDINIAFSSDLYLWKMQLLAMGAKEHLATGTYSR